MEGHENDRRRLEALMSEFLSDEEPNEYLSESYDGSDHDYVSSDSDSPVAAKRVKESIYWGKITGACLKQFRFTNNNFAIKQNVIEIMRDKQPIDFFNMFVDEEVLNLMVQETNRYGVQKVNKVNTLRAKRGRELRTWTNTDPSEMKIFLGLQIWFSLVEMPKLQCYWSSSVLYYTELRQVMTRCRFIRLLRNWHFTDNESINCSERLYKITTLKNIIKRNFQKVVIPSNNICVGETLVPFRSRLAFRQYINNRGHKFVIKLFKLCMEDGYTYDYKIYCEAEKISTTYSVPTSVVMGLCENLLDRGRTVYVNHTSLELAHKLLKRQTHLVGTLRKNSKDIPQEVTQLKATKGEAVGKESETGVVIIKWCDKREVLMLSTKHTETMTLITPKNRNERPKPEVVVDYNKSKSFVDLSNQVKAYATCLRRYMKWYHKAAVEILLCSGVVNAFIAYKQVTNTNISITQFREEIAKNLLQISPKISTANKIEPQITPNPNLTNQTNHILEQVSSNNRRRCTTCYKRLSEEFDKKHAKFKAKQSRWKCIHCQKFYCIPCFVVVHKCTL